MNLKVKYIGCSKDQFNLGRAPDDPREHLEVGKSYMLRRVNVYDCHSDIELFDHRGLRFNSVCFDVGDE